jgi:hypothetical protein
MVFRGYSRQRTCHTSGFLAALSKYGKEGQIVGDPGPKRSVPNNILTFSGLAVE